MPVGEPIFQPFPHEVIFQAYEPFKTYEASLRLRNNDAVRTHERSRVRVNGRACVLVRIGACAPLHALPRRPPPPCAAMPGCAQLASRCTPFTHPQEARQAQAAAFRRDFLSYAGNNLAGAAPHQGQRA